MKQKRKINSDFFAMPNIGLALLVLFGLYALFLSTFSPMSFPGFLGPLTTIVRNMGQNHANLCRIITVATVLCHIYEARLARKYCRKLKLNEAATIKWTATTFIFGYPSLKKIIAAANDK